MTNRRSPRFRTADCKFLRLIGSGLTTDQIAQPLHLSTNTIGTHREHLRKKLNLQNSAQLVRFATFWVSET